LPKIPDFLKYHNELANILQKNEPDIWSWFSSDVLTQQAFDDNRLTLLKNAIRLDPETHKKLFAAASDVARLLEIDMPISLYQGTNSQRNAALIYTPSEINIMFEGETLEILSDTELRCLLGHEMAHFLHKIREGGRYFTTDRMLSWICGERGAHHAHVQSLWLSQLYQEVFADRIGFFICEDRDAAISLLIKMSTGLKKFSVDGYLTQASEALDLNKKDGSHGVSHPETYIRALALADWADNQEKADLRLPELLEGDTRLERLDLLEQHRLTELTRKVIEQFLSLEWASSEEVEAHARSFFPGFERQATVTENPLTTVSDENSEVQDYLASILLDFAAADPDLEDEPLKDAIVFGKRLGLLKAMEPRIVKDLGVAKKTLSQLIKSAEEVAQ
jgi:hypothetical protein